jgi:hypothetical protein
MAFSANANASSLAASTTSVSPKRPKRPLLCVMDTIFRSEFAGAGDREHEAALRRFEYHRYLVLAGAWLDLKGA